MFEAVFHNVQFSTNWKMVRRSSKSTDYDAAEIFLINLQLPLSGEHENPKNAILNSLV